MSSDREELRYFVEVLVLTSFAIAQPLLDVVGRSSDFFVYHRLGPAEIVAFVLLVAFELPVLVWGAGLATRVFGAVVRRRVHLATVATLVTLLCYQGGKLLKLPTGIPLGIAGAVAGLAVTARLLRGGAARSWFVYATPAPLVFALLFVFTTPAGTLVRGGEADVRRVALARRPPIVLVFMDEFPLRMLLDEQGRVDARLFPNFARLARTTTQFTNATGIGGWTPLVLPAMLSGRFPRRALAPSYTLYPDTLFTLLAGSYRVKAFETISELCPPDRCDTPPAATSGLGPVLADAARTAGRIVSPYRSTEVPEQQFAEQPEPAASPLPLTFGFGSLGENQPERFTGFLESLRRHAAEPTLHFLHLLLPHQPHVYLPSGVRYPGSPLLDDRKDHTHSDQVASMALFEQRILLQLAYTDRLVGRMIDAMQRSGIWDESLFVLTADHGVGLVPGDRTRGLGDRNAADLAWVPLFVKKPGQRSGATDDRNYMHVDFVPTLAHLLGIRVPWETDGVSAFGPPRRTTEKYFYDEANKRLVIDPSRYRDRARRGVAGEIARPDHGVAGLFEMGPHGGLVGKQVASLPTGAASQLPLKVATSLRPTVTRGSGTVPAMTWGGLVGAGSQHTLVVAVNGVVGAVVETFRGRTGPRTFGAVVPDRLFREGPNEFRFYELDGGVLRPLDARGPGGAGS